MAQANANLSQTCNAHQFRQSLSSLAEVCIRLLTIILYYTLYSLYYILHLRTDVGHRSGFPLTLYHIT